MKKAFSLMLCLALLCAGTALAGEATPGTQTLELESNPTTGYEWTCRVEGTSVTVEEGEYQPETGDEDIVGAGGFQVFDVTWKEAGASLLVFSYARSWEEPDSLNPVVAYNAEADEEGQVTLTPLMDTRALSLSGLGTPEVTVHLEANASTGFTWKAELIENESEGLTVTDAGYEAGETDLPGAGGAQSYTLSGEKEGDYTVSFTYAQEWDTETPAVNTILLSVRVDADLNITLYTAAEE